MKYNREGITERVEAGENVKYVFFCGHTSKNGQISKACLSQWYNSPFEVNGIKYKTTEHWMMAYKAELFGDLEIRDKIIESNNPGEVKDLGRQIRGFDEIEWNKNKFYIVLCGNYHKFNQNPDLKEYLINTKERIIVEASPVDKVWGIGLAQNDPNAEMPSLWEGPNLLGFALMETRDLLQELETTEINDPVLPPWIKHPEMDRYSIGWRMGYGEEHFDNVIQYFKTLNDKQMRLYELTFPAIGDWFNWYNE